MSSEFPIPQDSLEQGLLSAAISSEGNWISLKEKLSSEDFSTQRNIFNFIEEYKTQYGNLPSSQLISSRFDWHPPLGDFNYWFSEMKRYVLARKLTEVLQETFKNIGKPQEALNMMLDKASLIRSYQDNHVQAYDASAEERLSKYRLRNKYLFNSDRVLGMRTGMQIIDDTKIGWMPGTLTGAFARPGVGKTWWLIWEGAISWCNGYKVLAISSEMSASQLALRSDVIVGNMLDLPVNYNDLLQGNPSVSENYEKIVSILSSSQRWWNYDSINGNRVKLSDISHKIMQHKPDILLIDNLSQLDSGHRGPVWEQIRELSWGLKSLGTIHEIPILCTHHASNTARGRRQENNPVRGDDPYMPSLNDSADGDAFVRACDDVITMCGDTQSKYINWYALKKTRERGWQQQIPPRMALACDFANGKIVDLSEKGYSQDQIGEEARRVLNVTDLI